MDGLMKRGLSAGLAITATALLGATGAMAAQQSYAPGNQAKTLDGGSGGWTATDSREGPQGQTLCIVAGLLICPTADSSHSADGGVSGGYLNAEFSVVAGVAGSGTSAWESKPFVYRGAKGERAGKVTFKAMRKSDLSELLALPDSSAKYSAEIVPTDGGAPIGAGDGDIPATSDWTALAAADVPRGALKRGKSYSIRITSVYETGPVGVTEDGTVGYDNVRLIAKRGKGGGGGGTATRKFRRQARNGVGPAVERGKHIFVKVRCPKAAAPDSCSIKTRALMTKTGPRATNAKRVKATAGQKRFVRLTVKRAQRSKVAAKRSIFAKVKFTAGAQKTTVLKRVKVRH